MRRTVGLLIAGLALLAPLGLSAAERYRGNLVDTAGAVPGRSTSQFEIEIRSYTSDQEAAELAQYLVTEGPQKLWDRLVKMDNGWMRVGQNLGYPIAVVRAFDTPEGGRVIRVATDRPIQMAEVMRGLRSGKLEIESLGTQPFRILNVRRLKEKGE